MIAALLASKLGRAVAGYAAVAIAVLVAVWRIFAAGKRAAQTEGLRKELKNVETRHDAETAVDGLKPDAVRDELLRDWAKPK